MFEISRETIYGVTQLGLGEGLREFEGSEGGERKRERGLKWIEKEVNRLKDEKRRSVGARNAV